MNTMRVEHAWTGLAESLALRHFPKRRVDPEVIARAEGLEVVHAPFREEIDGMLVRGEGKDWIVVNTRRVAVGSGRSRFTAAHELGHWFERRSGVAMRVPGVPAPGERSVDRFAAHLLMPASSFAEEYFGMKERGLAGLALLAARFDVSLTAAAYRAVELDLVVAPAAVLLWSPWGERCGRRVSGETMALGGEFWELAAVPARGTVTAGALRELAWGRRSGVVLAWRWFTGLDGYDEEHHRELREEVMSRGGHGWITLLSESGA